MKNIYFTTEIDTENKVINVCIYEIINDLPIIIRDFSIMDDDNILDEIECHFEQNPLPEVTGINIQRLEVNTIRYFEKVSQTIKNKFFVGGDDSFESALKWGKENLVNFNTDLISIVYPPFFLKEEIDYNQFPVEVNAILDTFDENEDGYAECARIVNELNLIGWTAEYYLDAELYDIKPIPPPLP